MSSYAVPRISNVLTPPDPARVIPCPVDLRTENGDTPAVASDNARPLVERYRTRSCVGAELKPFYEEEARARQGTRTDIQANLPECSKGQSRDHAAAAVNVSPRSAEIDENLRRNELTVLDRAEHEARRKEITLALHPQTAKGVAGALASNKAQGNATAESAVASYVKQAAHETGRAERTIREDIQIAESLPAELKDAIRDTDLADRKTDLLEIARLKTEPRARFRRLCAALPPALADSLRTVAAEYVANGFDQPRAELSALADLREVGQ